MNLELDSNSVIWIGHLNFCFILICLESIVDVYLSVYSTYNLRSRITIWKLQFCGTNSFFSSLSFLFTVAVSFALTSGHRYRKNQKRER